jgi:hypothetical protein
VESKISSKLNPSLIPTLTINCIQNLVREGENNSKFLPPDWKEKIKCYVEEGKSVEHSRLWHGLLLSLENSVELSLIGELETKTALKVAIISFPLSLVANALKHSRTQTPTYSPLLSFYCRAKLSIHSKFPQQTLTS